MSQNLQSTEATLTGYTRKHVTGKPYCSLKQTPEASLTGRLYYNLSQAHIDKLNSFEGSHYKNATVEVRDQEGKVWSAIVYLHDRDEEVEDRDWDLGEFLRNNPIESLKGF